MATAYTKRLVLAELLIFITLAGITALLTRPFMGFINKNTGIVHSKIIENLEKSLNRPIRYGSMGPSLIRLLEFRNITIGNEPEPLVRVNYLCLEFSLWGLFRGKGAGALRNVVLDKPEIYYHALRDKDIADLFSSGKKTGKPFVLPPRFHADIQNGSFLATTGKSSFGVTGVYVDGSIQKSIVRVNGNWNVFSPAPEGLVTTRGSINGTFANSLKEGSVTIYAASIEGRAFEAGTHTIALSFLEDRIHIERVSDSFPLQLYAEFFPEKKELTAHFFADTFLLEKMIRFSGDLKKMEMFTALSLSGQGSLQADFSGNGNSTDAVLDYRFNVTGDHSGSANGKDMPLKAFAFEGEGNGQAVAFKRFIVEANHGSVNYDGDILFNPFLPQGEMRFSGFSVTGESDINGNLIFTRDKRGVKANAPFLSFGTTVLSSFNGEFYFENGGGYYTLGFERSRGQSSASLFGVRGLFSAGTGFSPNAPETEATIALVNFYAADLVNLARPFISINAPNQAAFLQKTAFTTELSLRTGFNGFSFQTGQFLASYGGKTFLSASITGSDKQVSISDGRIWQQQKGARFEGNANYSDINNVRFNLSAGYQDFSYAFTGSILNGNAFSVEGSNGFFLTARQYEGGGWTGSMSVSYLPVPFRGHRAFLRLDSSLQYRNTAFWNLNLNNLELRDTAEQLGLTVRGTANQNGFNLDRISYMDQGGPLDGSAAAVWNGDFSFIDGSFVLNDIRETEIFSGNFLYESGTLEYNGSLQAFKLDRLLKSGKNLRVTCDLNGTFSGEEDYTVNCSLDSFTGRNGENSFYGSANLFLDPEQIVISKAKFSMEGINVEMPNFSMDHLAGRLEAEIRAGGRKNGREFGANFSLGVNCTPVKTWFDYKEAINSLSGILDVSYAFIDNIEAEESFSFVFSRISAIGQDSVIRLSGGPKDMLNLEFLETKPQGGVFALSLSSPSPVQGTITGSLEGSLLDALATEVYIDMGGLWDVIPVDDKFRFIGGFISGETRIYGSIFDPEFDGSAWGSGLRLVLPYYVPAELGPGSGSLTLEGSDMSFGPVTMPCEDGKGTISGSMRFNRWRPSFNLDIEVDKSVPFDFSISGIMAKGNATGSLNVILENDEIVTITGVVDATDTEITLDTSELEKGIAESGMSGRMDTIANVHINTSRRVEFLWPNTQTPLLRAYGETETGIQVTGDTRIPRFSIDGTITLRGGEIYYFQRSFMIREGVLKFNGNDPKIDPFMSARAEIRDQNDDGPVIIAMIVDNIPLRDLLSSIPRFESTPSLSQMEIYNLLGQAPTAEEGQNLNPLIYSTIDVILQTMIFRGAEQGIRNLLGLDMFSFRTQIVQNAVYEGLRSRQPDEKAVTMGNYLDNTAVFMGKYVGSDMFIQTMFSVKYDPNQTNYGGIKLETDIGLDFRTPLFDVRWSISPSKIENLFVSDQSISLVWRWSL